MGGGPIADRDAMAVETAHAYPDQPGSEGRLLLGTLLVRSGHLAVDALERALAEKGGAGCRSDRRSSPSD